MRQNRSEYVATQQLGNKHVVRSKSFDRPAPSIAERFANLLLRMIFGRR